MFYHKLNNYIGLDDLVFELPCFSSEYDCNEVFYHIHFYQIYDVQILRVVFPHHGWPCVELKFLYFFFKAVW